MKASDARRVTDENLKGPVIQPYLLVIYNRIEAAAREGKSSISEPFYIPEDYNGPIPSWPSSEAEDAVFKKLTEDGYKVVRHPDPDPGHPCSRPYTTISW